MKNFFLILYLISSAVAGIEHDNILNSDLMKQLKESGVIDQFENELKEMLKEKEGTAVPQKVAEKPATESKNEVSEFIHSYIEEKNIPLDARILEHLSKLPICDEGQVKHFVHLTQILDKISEIALLDDKDLDKKVIDIIKRVKSLPVMKTSLNKLIHAEPDSPTLIQKKVDKEAESSSNELELGVSHMVRDFMGKLKKKPELILDTVLPLLSQYKLVSDSTIQMARMYGQGFVRSENFGYALDTIADSIDVFAQSAGGKRMIALAPQILAADDKESIMDLIRTETESSWEDFFGRLDNSDVADQFVSAVANGFTSTVTYVRGMLKDDMKMALGNTFLISQGFPAIKPKKLTESVFNLADKCIRVSNYISELKSILSLFDHIYFPIFSRFSQHGNLIWINTRTKL
jgi:hypothetical protein